MNVPPEISRDKSELDYLRRTNMEAWEEAPKPRLMPAKARKLRPTIVVRPILAAWAAEFFGHPATTEKSTDEGHKNEKRTAEELRRDSGVGMDDDDDVDMDLQNSNKPTEDCHCRRDSGISMHNEADETYQTQAVADKCGCDGKQYIIGQALFFDNEIDEARMGIAL